MLTEAELQAIPESLRFKVETELSSAQALIRHLRDQIRLLTILKYGPASEKLTEAQVGLMESEPGICQQEVQGESQRPESEKAEVAKVASKRTSRGTFTMPADLPRQEEIIRCEEQDCICPVCQGQREVIGYEVSERLHTIPAQKVVKVTKREKMACKKCEEGGVQTAPLPAQIISKGIATNEMVVDVVCAKYELHIPLYRQEMQIARECGVQLTRQTMCGWMMEVGFLLGAVTQEMLQDLLDGGYLQVDETPIGVQDGERTGKNHRGYLWEYSRPGGEVVFNYQDGRGREGPERILRGFVGVLQTDDYAVYNSLRLKNVKLAGCMAHVRRKFVEASKVYTQDKELVEIITTIGSLYGVEREAREGHLTLAARQALRQEKSMDLMAKLKTEIVTMRQRVLPKSMQGRACDYALGQWEKLEVYLTDGEVEIDNNWCENAIRPVAIGRKNWLHFGSKEAGPNIAAIMSVVESCRRLGINVREYLLDVLPKLATGKAASVITLAPSAWKRFRSQADVE